MSIQRILAAVGLGCSCALLPLAGLAAPAPVVVPSLPSASPASASFDGNLPDAPTPTTSQNATSAGGQAEATATSDQGKQTKRILGIVPNFRAVSADQKLPPQSAHDKFKTTFQDSFDYSAFIFAAAQAGVAQAQDSYPAFRQGSVGYSRYLWHTFADQTDENLLVEGILPSALHQDNRYYTLGHGGFVKRAAYSFTRTLITRSDSGHEEPNYSEIVGAGGASGIASTYYPGQYRTWTKVGQRWLTSVVIDGATFSVKEFWPDVNSAIFHQKD